MIWKEIDLFDIAKDIKPEILGNEIFIDLSNVEANGHKENVDNRKIECIRAMGGGIDLDSVEKVLLSLDNVNYENIDLKDRLELDEQSRLEINLHEDYKVKFIKIIWNSRIPTQNIKIEVLNRKFVGLLIASPCGRGNGWGDRILSIITAMQLADNFGYKFGFIWFPTDLNIVCFSISDKEKIFTKEYIDTYCYNKICSIFSVSEQNIIRSVEIFKNIYYWGSYVNFWRCRPSERIYNNFPKYFKKIGFKNELQDLFIKTKEVLNNFKLQNKKDFVCFNIRSGEGIFKKHFYTRHITLARYTPAEIAIELIYKLQLTNKTIVILGDDIQEIQNMKKFFEIKNIDIFLITDILQKQEDSNKKALQEIVFMSHSYEVYGHGQSGFELLPKLIGSGLKSRSWELDLTKKEQLDAINKYFGAVELSREQHGFSKYYSYILHRDIYPNDWIGMSTILENAIKIFPDNFMYRWILAECYIKLSRLNKADEQIQLLFKKENLFDIIESYNTCFMAKSLKSTFTQNFDSKYSYLNLISRYMQSDLINLKDKETQNLKRELSSVKKNMYEKEKGSAKTRIQNHLAYKLGKAIIENSKSIWGYIRMPYVLSYIAEIHNKESTNRKEKLPPLETLPDYKEALRYKEHLSYKLGEAWLKGYKTWYKGGLIKFYFEAKKIKKEHNNK